MRKMLLVVAILIAVLAGGVLVATAGATEQAPEQPNPYCTWVEPQTTVVHHDAVTHEECYPPVTHTELSCEGIGSTWTYFNWIKFYYGTFFVPYEKSSDPTKCHMPSSNDLKNVYGMSNGTKTDFKSHRPDWILGNQVVIVDEEGYCETVVDQEAYDEEVVVEEGYWDCPDMCQYNPDIPADDPKCKPPEVCKEEKLYKMATFEFPSGQVGTLVSWDGYPPNVSRQLCWFGEIATNMPIFEYVTRNSCTGEIHYNGELYDYYNPALETPHWSGTCAVGGCG